MKWNNYDFPGQVKLLPLLICASHRQSLRRELGNSFSIVLSTLHTAASLIVPWNHHCSMLLNTEVNQTVWHIQFVCLSSTQNNTLGLLSHMIESTIYRKYTFPLL